MHRDTDQFDLFASHSHRDLEMAATNSNDPATIRCYYSSSACGTTTRAGSKEMLGTAENFVTDAQLAALAIAHGAVLHTADSDFLRFRGLRWCNPITGVASRGLSRSKRS